MKKTFLLFVTFIFFAAIISNANAQTATDIKMNEIYSRGGSTVHPDADWIELYNSSNSTVDISGYKIYDSGGQSGVKPKKEIPAGTLLPAKGFYFVVTDGTGTSDFGLSSSGEQVWLEDKAGTVIDNVTFPTMTDTQVYGREFNGTTWKLLSTMTKGLSNSVIVLNEFYSRGTDADPDWVEIYNSSASEVDLTGYKIYDSSGQSGSKPKKEIPAGTKIAAKGFFVIQTENKTNPHASDFGLSSTADEVWLENNSGAIIDNYAFGTMTENQSISRVPDGGNWKLANTITKGKTNGVATSVKLDKNVPTEYSLFQNYPNPFNPSTKISYSLPFSGNVELKVYDVLGKEIISLINQYQNAGVYTVDFSGFNIPSGIYFYRLQSVSFVQTRKMMLVK